MIVDLHAHLGRAPDAIGALLAVMARHAIARTVVVAGGVIAPDRIAAQQALPRPLDLPVDNAAVLAGCGSSRGRLIPFYFANPHRGVEPYREEGAAFAGLKLGPVVHGVPLDDPRTAALCVQAGAFGHPVYLHCLAHRGFDVPALAALAGALPRVRFILGHAGIGTCDFGAIERIADLPNVHYETSGGFTSVVAAAIKRLGASRVLFGSEWPLQHPAAELAKLRCLDLSPATLAAVLGGNAARLLSLSSDDRRSVARA